MKLQSSWIFTEPSYSVLRVTRGRKCQNYVYMYQLCNHMLKQAANRPYLGVIISEDLKWSSHIASQNIDFPSVG